MSTTFLLFTTFYFSCRGEKFEKLFMQAMYALGNHDLACEWSESCRKDYVIYDYEWFNNTELVGFTTGEITYPNKIVLRKLSHEEVMPIGAHTRQLIGLSIENQHNLQI